MRTPLAYNDASNRCTTYRAGLPGTLVNPERILKFPTSIYPIDAGAIVENALFEHLTDSEKQLPSLN